MNDLSWFLYLAGVAPQFAGTAGFFAILFGLASLPSFFLYAYATFECNIEYEKDKRVLKASRFFVRLFPTLCVILALVSTLIPSKETFYLIAASEIGEQVVKDPRVQGVTNKSFQAIEAFLDEQITKAEKAKVQAATNDVSTE